MALSRASERTSVEFLVQLALQECLMIQKVSRIIFFFRCLASAESRFPAYSVSCPPFFLWKDAIGRRRSSVSVFGQLNSTTFGRGWQIVLIWSTIQISGNTNSFGFSFVMMGSLRERQSAKSISMTHCIELTALACAAFSSGVASGSN